MRTLIFVFAAVTISCGAPAPSARDNEVAAWQQQARNVTIVRDNWGIPHIYGKTDADAVFGLMYAQAEDDFNRVETNYLNAMGRLAEAEGEREVYRDLRMKLFIDPDDLKAKYKASPDWLKLLMNAYADGLNYYLLTHPNIAPKVIQRFEPWMALAFTEGSIGGDIERIDLTQLEAFYRDGPKVQSSVTSGGSSFDGIPAAEPTGSNGLAIAPSNTASGHTLLLINPHTSFYFRTEVQMASDEGLNAYGAVTWGQFFVYQGFNERAGWMHTSSGVDNIDEYLETIVSSDGRISYRYRDGLRPLETKTITVQVKTAAGIAGKDFTVYRTHHGPIVRAVDGKWVSVRLFQDPVKALIQSYTRTKAKNYQAFRETMELHTNSSNNTVFADADGTIAYFHANFIPRRDARLDWTKPVDGSDPSTEWNGLHSIDETPGVTNPATGWVFNTNNWPWTAAGPDSPKRSAYPRYVERGVENARGMHAMRLLGENRKFTLDSLIAAAYDRDLPAFHDLIPVLLTAWDRAPGASPLKTKLSEQIALLRGWDFRWSATSIPTTVAVYWGDEMDRRITEAARRAGMSNDTYIIRRTSPDDLLGALSVASDKLASDFGRWNISWGEVNRFQRLTADIVQPFDDLRPSLPVGFTSGRWGSLAAFGARTNNGTKRIYGTTGNSFVAAVEFGDRVRARAVSAGGESGNPASSHFTDQATRYGMGDLRDVYFYRSELDVHIERQYHPGQ